MKRSFILLLFLLGAVYGWKSSLVFAQGSSAVSGQVVDTTLNISLENTAVTLMHARDSILVATTRSDAEGRFRFEQIAPGRYLLLASYPKYTDFVQEISLDSLSGELDLGAMNMILVANLLKDVVITGSNMITIKGDTIEYDADKFTIQPNSKVEDLLAQLPGIQVDADGTITAQGKTVNKVLVDGEEFFGDDPTLVTRNIRGDMVDKVQLYDKKSDQATFTGIDDGQRTKTINIKLKEDSKNGMFGKLDAGKAHNKHYEAQGMVNIFRGDEKFAAYGTSGNTNRLGLGWRESETYGGSSMVSVSGGGITITISGGGDALDAFDGRYRGEGLPLAHNGGLHYDARWDDKKHSINANYKIGSLKVEGNSETFTQNNLPSGLQDSRSTEEFDNHMFRQKADVRYEVKPDSTSSIRLSVDGTLKNSRSNSGYTSATRDELGQMLNDGTREISNESDNQQFNADVLWNKKLGIPGRTISLNLSQSLSNTRTEGYLDAANNFYNDQGGLDSSALINQQKIHDQQDFTFNSSVAYTEPLSAAWSLALNYRISVQNGLSNQLSYNYDGQHGYNELDSLYSNDFKLNNLLHTGSANIRYNGEKTSLSMGLGWQHTRMEQLDRFTDIGLNRSFSDFQPSIEWSYKMSAQKTIRLNYWGSARQPSLQQIQPLRSNLDPLNVHIGNPDLDPSYNHSVNGSFNSFQQLTGTSFFLYFDVNANTNPIVQDVMTDEVGKTTYRYVNLSGHVPISYNASMSYGNQVKALGNIRLSANLGYNGNTYYNRTNQALNKTISSAVNFNLRLTKNAANKYSYNFSAGPNYSVQEASLQTERSNKALGWSGSAGGKLFLPGKIELYSDASYQYQPATEIFDTPFEKFLWDVGVAKKFLKDESLRASITAYDILNQNVGFSRSANYNMNTQRTYTTLLRYVMFSVSWDFNKMNAKK